MSCTAQRRSVWRIAFAALLLTAGPALIKLAAYARQNGLAHALRELGKLERTIFALDWLQDMLVVVDTWSDQGTAEVGRGPSTAVQMA